MARKAPWYKMRYSNQPLEWCYANLCIAFDFSTTKKKWLRNHGEDWGADIAQVSDPDELARLLSVRANHEATMWQTTSFKGGEQAFLYYRGLPRPEREAVIENAQDWWILHRLGPEMVAKHDAARLERKRRFPGS